MPLAALAIVLDEDCETGEKRVVVQVTVDMTPDDAVERYDEYVRRWVATAPPDARYLMGLSLAFRGGNGSP